MHDHVSRLVGLEGFEVKGVIEEGDRLDLEVALVARAGCCPDCGRSSLDVKERPVVRVRDLPIAGRVTYPVWRKRRYRCRGLRAVVHRVASRAAGAPARHAALPPTSVRAGARRRRARRAGAL
jgi:transposase